MVYSLLHFTYSFFCLVYLANYIFSSVYLRNDSKHFSNLVFSWCSYIYHFKYL